MSVYSTSNIWFYAFISPNYKNILLPNAHLLKIIYILQPLYILLHHLLPYRRAHDEQIQLFSNNPLETQKNVGTYAQ